jgi:hypothetical protein
LPLKDNGEPRPAGGRVANAPHPAPGDRLREIDGAFSLYLLVLKLVEPRLKPGALVFGKNAFEQGYLDYVRNPANGYVSMRLPIDEANGNEFTVRKV